MYPPLFSIGAQANCKPLKICHRRSEIWSVTSVSETLPAAVTRGRNCVSGGGATPTPITPSVILLWESFVTSFLYTIVSCRMLFYITAKNRGFFSLFFQPTMYNNELNVRWRSWTSSWRVRSASSCSRLRKQVTVAAALVPARVMARTTGLMPRYRCSSRLSTCFQPEPVPGQLHSSSWSSFLSYSTGSLRCRDTLGWMTEKASGL